MKINSKHMIIVLLTVSFIVITACSKKTSCFYDPQGSFTSDSGEYEKVVIMDNNKIYLYQSMDTILFTTYTKVENTLYINTNPAIAFQIIDDQTLLNVSNYKWSIYQNKSTED